MFFAPTYIPQALNTGTCIQRAYTGTGVSHNQHRKKLEEVLEKNAGEWTRRVETSKEEIPEGKRSMYGYILTYSRL